jgi:hypothetical protein
LARRQRPTIMLAHNVHEIALPALTERSPNRPNLNKFNDFHPPPLMAHKLQSPVCLRSRTKPGVALDYFVR